MKTPKIKILTPAEQMWKKIPLRDKRIIVKRYVKAGDSENIDWSRELSTLKNLWKKYPSLHFWLNYCLPFGNNKLNHLTWFYSEDGKVELERGWSLHHYDPNAVPETVPEPEPDPFMADLLK
jgi:hypothetical protein